MVHWDRKAFRRRLMLQIGVLLLLLIVISLTYQHKQEGLDKDAKELRLIAKEIIPLKEISGMATFKENGQTEIALIGDNKPRILLKNEDKEYDFKNILVERFSLCQSEDFDDCNRAIKKLTKNWEGLAVDGLMRFFALQEHSQAIVVMNRQMDKVEGVLHFNFAAAFSGAVAMGAKKIKRNALGEGLVLLKNGHVIIAKEAFPVAFVEFGPEGDSALGLNGDTLLGEGEAFAMKEGVFHHKLVPLNTWTLATHGKCDISDLAIDENKTLLALSEDCLNIQRYDRLVPGEEAVTRDIYILPGEIKSPEALACVNGEWLVGSDVSSKKQYNYYRLSPQSGLK